MENIFIIVTISFASGSEYWQKRIHNKSRYKKRLIVGWNEPAGREPAVEEEQDDGRRDCEPRDQSQQRDRERTEAYRGGSSPGRRVQQEPRRTGKHSFHYETLNFEFFV